MCGLPSFMVATALAMSGALVPRFMNTIPMIDAGMCIRPDKFSTVAVNYYDKNENTTTTNTMLSNSLSFSSFCVLISLGSLFSSKKD